MDDDLDLRNFSGVTRLFPLPGVVMFPHSILPLHIFEPRYRQMTEDALADDKLVTIVQLRAPGSEIDPPPIEAVGCLGRILQHERLVDGRYNFLLLGRKRVQITREVPNGKLYRSAEVQILDDMDEDACDRPVRELLARLFRRVFRRQSKLDPDLATILDNPMPLGVLTDIVAHALGLPAELKQQLLAEPRVGPRANCLLSILQKLLEQDPGQDDEGMSFPPPFSAN
jgi:Lon protease-like protein